MVTPRSELETLAYFGVDPAALDPGPADTVQAPGWRERVTPSLTRRPCSSCSEPATSTRLVPLPGIGPRWVDACRDCMVATWHYRAGRQS